MHDAYPNQFKGQGGDKERVVLSPRVPTTEHYEGYPVSISQPQPACAHPHLNGDQSYVVLAPTIARPDSVYQLVVGIIRSDAPILVRASLVTTTSGTEVGQAIATVNPGDMEPLKIKVRI
ncbi:hypothetical protein SK128_009998 [Halocaridina rubra]|uniref:Uncharacterized protein n=1 Tax=Halocaridina rubra TaxID=373956 RepID=A0AAN9AFC4_HALRR